MKKVVIVIANGAARSGKTTLQNLVKKHFEDIYNIRIMSSVDVMYQVYRTLGWNGVKDDTFRNNMHTLKQMYIDNCDGPTRDIIKAAVVAMASSDANNTIIFYDIREAEEINKLIDLVKPLNIIGIYCKTMLIRRTTVENLKHGNHADDDVLTSGIEYDITVDNSGDLKHLEGIIDSIVKQILEVQIMEPENNEMIAIDLGCTDPNEFVNALDQMHRSKGHEVIRDHMSPFMLKKIREDTERYKKFQDIKMECKKSYEYDRKVATMLDVNRGLTNLYNIILRLFASYKNGNDATLDVVCTAINKIEERLGMEQTDWTGGQDNAAGNTEDGEGIPTGSDRTE